MISERGLALVELAGLEQAQQGTMLVGQLLRGIGPEVQQQKPETKLGQQTLVELIEARTFLRLHDLAVKQEIVVRSARAIPTIHGFADLSDGPFEAIEEPIGNPIGEPINRADLQDSSNTVQIHHVRFRQRCDGSTSVDGMLHETLVDQHANGFSQCVPRHAERRRQGCLSKRRTRRKLAIDDLASNEGRDLIGRARAVYKEGAPSGRLGHAQ